MSNELEIRPAHPDEAPRLTEIAHAAKRHWGYGEDLIELWRADLTVTREFVETHPVFVAVVDARIVGFCALEGDELEHMWVAPEAMATGVGRALFERALNETDTLRIASDPNAEGFYLRMGAERIGEVPSRPEGRTLPLLVRRR